MMNTDELDPPRPVLKPVDMQMMSIEDLENYIVLLKTEIERAEQMIDKKKAHKSGAESLFSR